MNAQPRCIICSRDGQLRQSLEGYLKFHASLTWTTDVSGALLAIDAQNMALLLLDLRAEDSIGLIKHLKISRPAMPVIAFGEPRCTPAIEADQAGVYAIQSLEPDRRVLQNLVEHAHNYLSVSLENRLLNQASARAGDERSKSPPWERAEQSRIPELSKAFRSLDETGSLFDHIVGALGSTIMASRAGLVALNADASRYSVRATLRCLPHLSDLQFTCDSPLVLAFKSSAQVVSRLQIDRMERSDWGMLLGALDDHGADAIVPLFGKTGLLGWFFVGPRATGAPYDNSDLETLLLLGESLSAAVEKALLYEKSGLQKRLLESLFDSLPGGIVAVNDENIVLWLNQAAEGILGVKFDDVVNNSCERLGSKFADFLSRAQSAPGQCRDLIRTATGALLQLNAQHLSKEHSFKGLLLVIEDVTIAETLRLEHERLQHSEILGEMCRNMAAEIRSPLTAIQTFTQLLPERHMDREFCARFELIVRQEIDRLTALSDNIGVASRLIGPASPSTRLFDPKECIEIVENLFGDGWSQVQSEITRDLPRIEGNPERLAECICHLLSNAREATARLAKPRIRLTVGRAKVSKNIDAIQCAIHDNRPVRKVGAFVDNSSLGSDSSIFRADLRLSFASDIIRENAGMMEVLASNDGVCVSFLIPTTPEP